MPDRTVEKKEYYLKHRKEIIRKVITRHQQNKEAYNSYMRGWRQKNKEHIDAYKKQYYKTGKPLISTNNWRKNNRAKYAETKSKGQAKRNRNLGFNKLIENDWDCKINWHHVNDNDVIPIPANLHRMCHSNSREKHRKICNELINILYEGEIKV